MPDENNYTQECFRIAFEVFVFLTERNVITKLVHANIIIDGKVEAHAWLEYYDCKAERVLSDLFEVVWSFCHPKVTGLGV